MLNFKLKSQWKKTKIELEVKTNNSSEASGKEFSVALFLLDVATVIGIIKYLIWPLLIL